MLIRNLGRSCEPAAPARALLALRARRQAPSRRFGIRPVAGEGSGVQAVRREACRETLCQAEPCARVLAQGVTALTHWRLVLCAVTTPPCATDVRGGPPGPELPGLSPHPA